MNSRTGLTISLLIVLLALSLGCKKKEDTKSGLSGRVSVEGGSVEGVTVEIFEEPSYGDAEVWYYTNRERSVGFQYSAPAAFDWRRDGRLLLSRITTDADGRFNFPDLAENNYILVVRRDGFGWSVPRLIELRGESLDLGVIPLYAETLVPQTPLSGDVTWQGNGRHYVLEGDLNIPVGVSLTIEPGAFVRVDEPNRIVVSGALSATGTVDAYVSFTSTFLAPSPYDWDGVIFLPGAERPTFAYCRFDYATSAVRVQTNGATFDNCFFSNLASKAIDCTSQLLGETVSLTRCVFDHVSLDFRVYGISTVDVQHNIFFSARTFAVSLQSVRDGEIFCNWFQDCGRFDTSTTERSGVMLLDDIQNVEVYRNHVLQSAYAFDLGSRVDSTVLIHHNMLRSINRVMNVGVTEEQLGATYPSFNQNCMISIDKINVIVNSCHINTHNIDCTDNYWNTNSADVVLRVMILDCRDNPEGFISFVEYEPILDQCSGDVGICPN
ncbi:carboxypeptidase regulatory-like domain-containing protein [candidate division KSB1 bacterium]|nr:carboxypeptidase regulatory-like domain-containing protein [candidate division KSB1 bacterium]